MSPRRLVALSLFACLSLGIVNVSNAQDPPAASSTETVAPLVSLNVPQLLEQIEAAQREIANAEDQAQKFPDSRDACLDNRDAWRVELIALQGELVRRLTAENAELKRQLAAATTPGAPPQAQPPAPPATPPGTPPAAPNLRRPPSHGSSEKAKQEEKPATGGKPVDQSSAKPSKAETVKPAASEKKPETAKPGKQ